MNRPTLYIIAGCNGAGKTTASMSVLPDVLNCREFVNADEIAKGVVERNIVVNTPLFTKIKELCQNKKK